MAHNDGYNLIRTIGQDMCVLPGVSEDRLHYAERVILSAVSKWMLIAVHGGYPKASVKSVRSKVYDKLENFLKIIGHPECPDLQTVIDSIYDTLAANGMFNHEPDYVRPAVHKDIGFGDISVIRGLLPEEKAGFSGMAPYTLDKGDSNIADEFMLWSLNGEETIRNAWQHSSIQNGQVKIEEYMRLTSVKYQQYYSQLKDENTEYILGRTRKTETYGYSYYLIRNGEIRRMTDDFVNASVHQYVRLAIMNKRKKQRAAARIDRNLVRLEIEYYLPSPDARFLRLVSWPEDLQKIGETSFFAQLHPVVWPSVKERLVFLGYAVEETYE